MQNSHSRCGCGGARVFECVDYPMPTARRLTLDDRDDRGRDWVQRERPEVELEFSDPTSGRDSKSDPISGRKKNLIDGDDRKKNETKENQRQRDAREPKTTRQKKDVMNECSWMVSLVVLEVSPGGPPDVPSGTPRKRPKWARGLLGPEIVKF